MRALSLVVSENTRHGGVWGVDYCPSEKSTRHGGVSETRPTLLTYQLARPLHVLRRVHVHALTEPHGLDIVPRTHKQPHGLAQLVLALG
jgi:hypothetical protein